MNTRSIKTLGIIGGMSWESSLEYYRILNTLAKQDLGGVHSAPVLLDSLDFGLVEQFQSADDWESLNTLMADHAIRLARAGAQVIGIASNTMHRCWPRMLHALQIDFDQVQPIHIVRAIGAYAQTRGWKKLGLLGTKFTMEGQDYPGILGKEFGISVLTPNQEQRERIHRVIYDELVLGTFTDGSRKSFLNSIDDLGQRGVQGVILGCTEIPLLVQQTHTPIPLLDTTTIHCEALWKAAQGES